MASPSQKARSFASEPIREKPVSELPGIGPILGAKLAEKGFDKAYKVLGKFISLEKDRDEFMKWLKDTCGANREQQEECCNALEEWCRNFL